jgi:hypothetical protein
MAYLIEQGADATQVTGMTLVDTISDTLPSLGALELLVDHGWDINSRGLARGMPVLWFVVRDVDLVRWCLDHGADVDPLDDTPSGAKKHRKPILEVTAAEGNMKAFELLRAKGAPLDLHHGVLPSAVMSASYDAFQADKGPGTHFSRMLSMIRHLVGVVGCDVNSISYGSYHGSGSTCSTPLCWLAATQTITV